MKTIPPSTLAADMESLNEPLVLAFKILKAARSASFNGSVTGCPSLIVDLMTFGIFDCVPTDHICYSTECLRTVDFKIRAGKRPASRPKPRGLGRTAGRCSLNAKNQDSLEMIPQDGPRLAVSADSFVGSCAIEFGGEGCSTPSTAPLEPCNRSLRHGSPAPVLPGSRTNEKPVCPAAAFPA